MIFYTRPPPAARRDLATRCFNKWFTNVSEFVVDDGTSFRLNKATIVLEV